MSTANPEQALYEAVWQDPAYRVTSPGANQVPDFVARCQPKPEDTIIDIGCGTGQAIAALDALGYPLVCGVDLARNAPNPDLARRVVQVDISREAPIPPPFDWGFCCDVLEHLPPTDLPAALSWIQGSTRLGVYLQIALFPETRYHLDEPLHKNVQHEEYWRAQIAQTWGEHPFSSDGRRIIFVITPRSSGDLLPADVAGH